MARPRHQEQPMSRPLRFAGFELDRVARTLRRDGETLPLGARAFDVLAALVEQRGTLVTKEQLLVLAWPGLVVEEANVHVQVSALRKVLGAQSIATVAGLGYRFTLPVNDAPSSAPRHNLPAERSGFIGREAALADVEARLGKTRLLTLIGIGGTGKTRLAQRVASRVHADFPDGIWWVDLAPLETADALVSTVSQAAGYRLPAGAVPASETTALANYLHPLCVLLMFDNCEHLLDDVAALANALLCAAPRLKVLATSREALALEGESVLPVRPLALPGPDADPDTALQSEAVRLFVLRATAAAPGMALDTDQADTIVAICRRLDGIPLALELAAAQLKVVSPAQLLQLLQERFRLQAGARRSLPRQQTLQAVIEWSFGHLRPDEQELLLALSVCSGGCDLDAAAALADPAMSRATLIGTLSRLADQSLIDVRHGSNVARYELLETVRQFALERLHASGLAKQVRARHAAHFLQLAEDADRDSLAAGFGAQTLERLDRDRDNLLRAVDSCEADDPQAITTGLRLAAALRHYWPARGMLETGLRVCLAAVSRADSRPPDLFHSKAISATTQILWWTGRYEETRRWAETHAAVAARIDDQQGLSLALARLGSVARSMGRLEDARRHNAEALEVARRVGLASLQADAMYGLAAVATSCGRFDDAAKRFQEVIELRRQSGFGYGLAAALLHAAAVAARRMDGTQACSHLTELFKWLPRLDSRYITQNLVDVSAAAATAMRCWREATTLYAASTAQRERIGLPLHDLGQSQRSADLQLLRSEMGASDFENCWRDGLNVDHDDSIEIARRLVAGHSRVDGHGHVDRGSSA